jgi:methyltransferase (TIGR00027 family)
MQPKEPSRTAWGAARHRAVHQLIEGGRIFTDPLAVPILGGDVSIAPDGTDALVHEDDAHPGTRAMRFFIVSRSALAEARLAEAVAERGVEQLVVLGAGFDTFAYRNPFGDRLRVFEVDHPATQAWKRERLGAMGVEMPEGLTFVGVDFEHEVFADRLVEEGFDPAKRSFVFWLGVSMYLTAGARDATFAAVAGWPGGGEIVFDYAEPPHDQMSEAGRAARAALEARVAAIGEPFIGWMDPDALHAQLAGLGYLEIEDLGGIDLAERFLGPEIAAAARAAGAGRGGGHVLFART